MSRTKRIEIKVAYLDNCIEEMIGREKLILRWIWQRKLPLRLIRQRWKMCLMIISMKPVRFGKELQRVFIEP